MAIDNLDPFKQTYGEGYTRPLPKARQAPSEGPVFGPVTYQPPAPAPAPSPGFSAAPAPTYAPYADQPVFGGSAPSLQSIDSSSRARVEQALFDRLQPQFDRQNSQARSALLNSGIEQNTDAYRNEMDAIARRQNDARLAVTAAGGQEETRLNTLRAALQQQGFAQELGAGQFDNETRAQQLQELLLLRQQPLNELSALMGTPNAGPTNGSYYTSNANSPDFIGAANVQQNAQNQANANRNAGWGAAANFGSALLDYWGKP